VTARSAQIALTVAERLLDPEAVAAAVPGAAAGSLARGLAGIALLHARLAGTDPAFAAAAERHWTHAAACARHTGHEGPGVYRSPGGLAASLIIGTPYLPDPQSRRPAAAQAARWMSARAISLADQHRQYLIAGGTGTPQHAYDAITGLAGIGRVLLAAVRSGYDTEPGLMAALGTLTTMAQTRYGPRPGWWSPASAADSGTQAGSPGAATGMAHGIAGPLALLSLASLAGYTVDGQAEAIREASRWLLRWRTATAQDWPPHITETELDTGTASPVPGRRDAWCYGTPGIARSLALAGQATGDPVLTQAASAGLSSLQTRPSSQWDVEGAGLCHGYAGVLQSAAADQAATAVAALFHDRDRFGFHHAASQPGTDDPGFLTGAAGVALALADHGGLPAPPVADMWDTLLLLS
jgi:lantibiotic biosynthesis protein